jgi:hypothetical protein
VREVRRKGTQKNLIRRGNGEHGCLLYTLGAGLCMVLSLRILRGQCMEYNKHHSPISFPAYASWNHFFFSIVGGVEHAEGCWYAVISSHICVINDASTNFHSHEATCPHSLTRSTTYNAHDTQYTHMQACMHAMQKKAELLHSLAR